MNWNRGDLTPEERERIAKPNQIRGFYSIVVELLLRQPPVETQPDVPPKEEFPPSTYIPLAHR